MKDNDPSTPKQIIDPRHLLSAIENSIKHSDETTHGVTGLSFKDYRITVRKRKEFSWSIECKFKRGERNQVLSNVPVRTNRPSNG